MGSGMAAVKARPSGKATNSRLALDLFAPGMTVLHKAGLAGLWMTLDRFDRNGVRFPGGSWKLSDHNVTLEWSGKPETFFKALFTESFKTDRNNLVWFPALGEPVENLQYAVVFQEALLGTFLQFGKTRDADLSTAPTGALTVEVDDVAIPLRYRKIRAYAHQDGFNQLFSKEGKLGTSEVKQEYFPGAVKRHWAWAESALEEPAERLLPLIYSPVGAIYFRIRRRGEGVRPQYAIAVPEVEDLRLYARARASFLRHGIKDLTVSGTAEAGWRVLATLEASKLLGRLGIPACRVISFGTVPWSKQQKTRVELFTVRPGSAEELRAFRLCLQAFEAKLVKPENDEPFWVTPQTPGLIARNLTGHRAWHYGFADFVNADSGQKTRDGKRLRMWDVVTRNERGGLFKMVNQAISDERAQIFVRACHEAWRRRLGQLGERAKREGASFGDLASREYERQRVEFSRCKNAAALRETVTDFWARSGGSVPELAGGWTKILPLLGEQEWRTARDLALLALASYQPSGREEANAMASVTNTGEGEER
jgi:CRISPR-associated protein Cas8a1/Csx13